eukprot:scaffold6281_cov207-Ochromonas_danica.AAC.6
MDSSSLDFSSPSAYALPSSGPYSSSRQAFLLEENEGEVKEGSIIVLRAPSLAFLALILE